MKCRNKTSLIRRTGSILRDNEGTSLLLVAVIAILIITGVVILRVSTSSLWAAADKQQYQDRAYVMASSMGDSLDVLITENKLIDLQTISELESVEDRTIVTDTPAEGESVTAVVTKEGDLYKVTVRATVANGMYEYIYSAYYTGSGYSYSRKY